MIKDPCLSCTATDWTQKRVSWPYGERYESCDRCSLKRTSTANAFTPQRVKDERKQYKKDLIQPWRNGYASKEFMETYPKQSQKMFTTEEKKNASYVWKEM